MTPDDLSNLAAQRGCRHYWHEGVPEGELATRDQLSDEELAIALLNVALQISDLKYKNREPSFQRKTKPKDLRPKTKDPFTRI